MKYVRFTKRTHDGFTVSTSVIESASRIRPGEVAERLKAPVSKTGIGETQSGVRIPPSPILKTLEPDGFGVFALKGGLYRRFS